MQGKGTPVPHFSFVLRNSVLRNSPDTPRLNSAAVRIKLGRLWIRSPAVALLFPTRSSTFASGRSGSSRPAALFFVLLLCSASLLLSACGEKKRTAARIPPPPTITTTTTTTTTTSKGIPPAQDADGREIKVDKHAKVLWTQTGFASWYGPHYHNRRGANGEIYDMNKMTAAHNTLPLNSIVRVTNLKTNVSVIVRITDRGPFVGDRIIDLSKAAAIPLDVYRHGTAKVRLDVLETPHEIEKGGRWCVQVGAFDQQKDAIKLKEKLQRRYHTAKVLQFPGPTGYWVRVKVPDDDKKRAQEVARNIDVNVHGGVFLVRLD